MGYTPDMFVASLLSVTGEKAVHLEWKGNFAPEASATASHWVCKGHALLSCSGALAVSDTLAFQECGGILDF